MLGGIYAPTDLGSRDTAPSIPSSEKLEIISQYPALLRSNSSLSDQELNDYYVTLPFCSGAQFYMYLTDDHEDYLYSDYVNVGDRALYCQGLGSRILRAGIRYGLEINPELKKFGTNTARLGLINTAITVFGKENVSVKQCSNQYGWEGDKPLDQLLVDFPPQANSKYLVDSIEAKVDTDKAMGWEKPVPVSELAKLLDIKKVIEQQLV